MRGSIFTKKSGKSGLLTRTVKQIISLYLFSFVSHSIASYASIHSLLRFSVTVDKKFWNVLWCIFLVVLWPLSAQAFDMILMTAVADVVNIVFAWRISLIHLSARLFQASLGPQWGSSMTGLVVRGRQCGTDVACCWPLMRCLLRISCSVFCLGQ